MKKKIVYLISPKKIRRQFYKDLEKVLSYGNCAFFQLRLKNTEKKKILSISTKIKKITSTYKVKFIINDNCKLTMLAKADGCHMGQKDGSFKIARKKLKNKILGVTCHNSKQLARTALKHNPEYLAFGSFNRSKYSSVDKTSISSTYSSRSPFFRYSKNTKIGLPSPATRFNRALFASSSSVYIST